MGIPTPSVVQCFETLAKEEAPKFTDYKTRNLALDMVELARADVGERVSGQQPRPVRRRLGGGGMVLQLQQDARQVAEMIAHELGGGGVGRLERQRCLLAADGVAQK